MTESFCFDIPNRIPLGVNFPLSSAKWHLFPRRISMSKPTFHTFIHINWLAFVKEDGNGNGDGDDDGSAASFYYSNGHCNQRLGNKLMIFSTNSKTHGRNSETPKPIHTHSDASSAMFGIHH